MNTKYVAADRETFDAIAPCISAGVASVGSQTLNGKSFVLLQKSWLARIVAAEKSQ